jgi:hypothetical protein
MSTTVTTQKELNAALADDAVSEIIINSPRGVWLEISDDKDKYVRAYGSSTVRASGSSTVTAYDSSTVRAYGSSTVTASGSSTVRAYDSSTVTASGSSTVTAYDSSTVTAYGSSTVTASGSSTVRAYGSSTVTAYGSSTVRAYDSSTVTASGSSTVRTSGSSTVTAYGSSTVRAYGSSTVTASGSSTVRAYGSSTVTAYVSSTVTAYDSSTVTAYGSSTVTAYGSSTVRASGSSTVTAGKYTAVHLFSARVKVTGGVVIDVSKIDLADITDWADYYGTDIIGGQVIVYKAVNDNLKSPRGFAYPIGETVTAPDWSAGDFCGGGLHLSPSPQGAQRYFEEATRFLKCTVPVAELSVIDPENRNAPKLKAKTVTVLAEVDIHGNEVTK